MSAAILTDASLRDENFALGTVFDALVSLAVTADGSIYVVENGAKRVRKLEPVRPPE